MISYNVSITLEPVIEIEWVAWMKEHHIPAVMATGCFESYDFYKLIKPAEEEGVTFIVQYKVRDMATYDRYAEDYAPDLQRESLERYKDQFLAFRTLMVEA